jgi:anthranilate synthase component 1
MSAKLLQALRAEFGARDCVLFESPTLGCVVGVVAAERVPVRSAEDLKTASRRLAARASEARDLPGLPAFLRGGVALGWVGFDFVRHLEPKLLAKPFFRELGSSLDGEVSLFLDFVHVDLEGRTRGFCLSGDAAKQARLERVLRDGAPFFRELDLDFSPAADELPMDGSFGPEVFREKVARLKEHIAAGDIFQAVLSERFEVAGDFAPERVFAALERGSDAPYRFFLPFEDGFYLGASPELFLRSQGGLLETHPIAGTRPTGGSPAAEARYTRELLDSEKERAEHLMLVDLARNDLGRVAEAGSVSVPEFMALRRFRTILHLASRVTGRLRAGADALDAFNASFPAGTLSGAPKVRALEIIADLEPCSRGPYGGAVLALSPSGDLDSCIAIRGVRVGPGGAVMQAGAGIVADSVAEHEQKEVRNKLRSIRAALQEARAS